MRYTTSRLFFFTFLLAQLAIGQERFKTDSGTLSFDASSPLEDIAAVNNKVSAILDSASGEIAVVLLIKDFEFRRKLMQEHFNENYMHSDRYPKAVFTGTISNFNLASLTSEKSSFDVRGELTIHGVTREIFVPVTLWQSSMDIGFELAFVVRTEDHKIKVPRVVFKKVAQEVHVSGTFLLQKK